jgi:hypothetical protein
MTKIYEIIFEVMDEGTYIIGTYIEEKEAREEFDRLCKEYPNADIKIEEKETGLIDTYKKFVEE